MNEIERERIFLVKKLPNDILNHRNIFIQIGDFTLGNNVNILKIRRKGNKYELIKKDFISEVEKHEHIIPLTKEEFDLLYPVAARRHTKRRFFYPLGDYICELDIYLEDMIGYARAEVEFNSLEELNNFKCPNWFGNEITSLNQEIHENLGLISFKTMVDRFSAKGITLTEIRLPKEN